MHVWEWQEGGGAFSQIPLERLGFICPAKSSSEITRVFSDSEDAINTKENYPKTTLNEFFTIKLLKTNWNVFIFSIFSMLSLVLEWFFFVKLNYFRVCGNCLWHAMFLLSMVFLFLALASSVGPSPLHFFLPLSCSIQLSNFQFCPFELEEGTGVDRGKRGEEGGKGMGKGRSINIGCSHGCTLISPHLSGLETSMADHIIG